MFLARSCDQCIQAPGLEVFFELLSESVLRCSRSSSANLHASGGGSLRIASRISATVLISSSLHQSRNLRKTIPEI
jgi:hypothetical protein